MNDQERRARAAIRRAASTIMAVATLSLGTFVLPASAQQLNVICPVQAEWCNLAATEFEKETGIRIAVTLKGSGESFAQIAAEKANPKLDVWFGGTGDPHLQAGEQGLLEEYRSPMLGSLQPWAASATTRNCWRRKSWRPPPAGAT